MAVRLGLLLVLLVAVLPVAPAPVQAAAPVTAQVVPLAPGSAGPDASFATTGLWTSVDPGPVGAFAMVGLHTPEPVTAEIRTAQTGETFGPWSALPALHDGPDPASAEAQNATSGSWTQPVFTGPADRVEIRVLGELRPGAEVVLLDPFGQDRSWAQRFADGVTQAWSGDEPDPLAPPDPPASPEQPTIISRAEWGADESIVRTEPAYALQVDRAFLHHTVGINGYAREDVPAILRSAQAYHVQSLGWDDLGYNFLIDRFGRIFEGRAGGLTEPVVGSQAAGFNTGSTGIALMGNFEFAGPSPAALDGVVDLVAWLAEIHHFSAHGVAEVRSYGSEKYAEGEIALLDNLVAHRDVKFTTCPGNPIIDQLPTLRDRVDDRLGNQIIDHRADVEAVTLSGGRADVDQVTVRATMSPPGEWEVTLTDPMGTPLGSAAGEGEDVELEVPLAGERFRPGEYTYTVTAAERRTAVGRLPFLAPETDDIGVSPTAVTVDGDGRLGTPVRISGELAPGVAWVVEVLDPGGEPVFQQEGEGDVDVVWRDQAIGPGRYAVEVTVDEFVTLTRPVDLTLDLFRRVGDVDDAIGAAVAISATTFDDGTVDRAVIARHDVFADALAGGPLAGGAGPLLLTTSDHLDPRVADELDRILSTDAVIYVLGGTAAIDSAVTSELVRDHGGVRRLAGPTRIDTAAAIAGQVVAESGATTAMIARAGPDDAAPWADALAGGAYGAAAGVPVLLSDQEALSPQTRDALRDLGIEQTLILGGQAALSQAVAFDLPDGTRLAGPDRTATAVAIAQDLWTDRTSGVILAEGFEADAWAYALASAPLSARHDAPLILTQGEQLSSAAAAFLTDRDLDPVTVVGRPSLVSDAVTTEATALLD
ncbi:cell wall-binding repeat-containing protein [Euzebya tangerina]|uniref:cell wall-binding repeat-containing protein n=1 Tax=Euzebya tangerina TaxID=591198 RepID=UPI000E30FA92|nr:cell wall-binding repeat-containing protein [Euzebya tangerina]